MNYVCFLLFVSHVCFVYCPVLFGFVICAPSLAGRLVVDSTRQTKRSDNYYYYLYRSFPVIKSKHVKLNAVEKCPWRKPPLRF